MSQNQRPTRFEVWSAPALLMLHRMPRLAFPLFTALLLFAGMSVSSDALGGSLLVVLGLLLAWLIALSWRLLQAPAKLMRVISLLLIFGYAAGRFAGKVG